MVWLAVTTMEKLQQVPTRFWVNAGLTLAIGMVAILLVRHAARLNRLVLALIIFLLVTVVGFQWVFERNEPEFMTPYINRIAPYFPAKIDYRGDD